MSEQRKHNVSDKVEAWLKDDNLLLLSGWRRDGLKLKEVAEKIGITPGQLTTWKQKYPEIKEALRLGIEPINYKVEDALLKRALGYRGKEVKIRTVMRFGKVIETIKEVTEKEFAPDVSAIQTWLYNRKPDKWKKSGEGAFELSDGDTSFKIVVRRAGQEHCGDSVNEEVEVSTDDGWED